MSNKVKIENLDPPTICDNCIHDEVCGLEGHLEPALKYCGWKEEIRPKGKWKKIGEEYYNECNHNVIKCSLCGYVKDTAHEVFPHFCEDCGADMRGDKE